MIAEVLLGVACLVMNRARGVPEVMELSRLKLQAVELQLPVAGVERPARSQVVDDIDTNGRDVQRCESLIDEVGHDSLCLLLFALAVFGLERLLRLFREVTHRGVFGQSELENRRQRAWPRLPVDLQLRFRVHVQCLLPLRHRLDVDRADAAGWVGAHRLLDFHDDVARVTIGLVTVISDRVANLRGGQRPPRRALLSSDEQALHRPVADHLLQVQQTSRSGRCASQVDI